MEVKGHKECFLHAEGGSPFSLFEKEEKTEKEFMLTRYTNSAM